jgi:hypothetical protein
MKKILIFSLFLFSCDPPSITDPDEKKEFIIQVDSTRYKIKNINLGRGIGNIYVMIPESSKIFIPSIGIKIDTESIKTIIKIK